MEFNRVVDKSSECQIYTCDNCGEIIYSKEKDILCKCGNKIEKTKCIHHCATCKTKERTPQIIKECHSCVDYLPCKKQVFNKNLCMLCKNCVTKCNKYENTWEFMEKYPLCGFIGNATCKICDFNSEKYCSYCNHICTSCAVMCSKISCPPCKLFGKCDKSDNDYDIIINSSKKQKGIMNVVRCGYEHTNQNTDLILKSDESCGLELVTPPMELSNIDKIETFLEKIKIRGLHIDRACGLHVHFSRDNFTLFETAKVIGYYYLIQNILFKMMPETRKSNQYCSKINVDKMKNLFCANIKSNDKLTSNNILSFIHDISCSHYTFMNLSQHHATFELRIHEGTMQFEKIKQWVIFNYFLINAFRNISNDEFGKNMDTSSMKLKDLINIIEQAPVIKNIKKKDIIKYIYKRIIENGSV